MKKFFCGDSVFETTHVCSRVLENENDTQFKLIFCMVTVCASRGEEGARCLWGLHGSEEKAQEV